MASRPRPKPADYAAVGVGPVLIFVMISSLANFFVSLLYQGSFSDRAYYLILMYTMGSVALARLVIEQDRAYSAGYAIALGAAMLFVMTQFVGSVLFALGLILLIGYLADRIVHDCTVIDESIDASGEGLIDRGLDEVVGLSNQVNRAPGDEDAPLSEKESRRRKSHQPGRTVFLLALAALPLFGLGQFMLRDNPQDWARAQQMLGLYLFSSLSLLVTTSFLNLRRYLRQRDVDMPVDVTVAWIAGGVAMIAALLILAFLVPMPGKALANFSIPRFLETDEKTASRFGWGNEGADQSENESDAETGRDPTPGQKDQKGAGTNQNTPSGKPGGEKEGSQDGPQSSGEQSSGQQSSGEQSSGEQSSGEQSSGEQSSGEQSSGEQSSGEQSSGEQSSGEQSSGEQSSGEQSSGEQSSGEQSSGEQSSGEQSSGEQSSGEQSSGEQSSGEQSSGEQSSGEQSSGEQSSGEQSSGEQSSGEQSSGEQSSGEQSSGEQSSGEQSSDEQSSDEQSSGEQSSGRSNADQGSAAREKDASDSSDSSASSSGSEIPSFSDLLPAIGGLLRLLLILGLVAIVAFYLYQVRDQLARWWHSLFARDSDAAIADDAVGLDEVVAAPPKPFSSYTNPIGRQSDPRRIVVITFQAFDAWSRERDHARRHDETPAEFVHRLRQSSRRLQDTRSLFGPIESEAQQLASAYDRIVFGRAPASQRDLDAASRIWQHMTRSTIGPPVV